MVATALKPHDHDDCIKRVLSHVEAVSSAENLRLTPVRRRVLEILLEAHEAVGAYDLLKRLDAEGMKAQPPVAYRALDFLQEHGFVHKIEQLNAFVACMHPEEKHDPAFMICRECRSIAETRSSLPHEMLEATAAEFGFRIESAVIEVQGVCANCSGHSE
ncbi:transcriptional repressor [Rhodobacteraceae bacterium NNCM2]|nr:transcriptional repressor [Coraliihabitans acroporae]